MGERLEVCGLGLGRCCCACFEEGAGRDDAGGEDEGPDAKVHEGCAPVLDFGKAAGEDGEVDGEDGQTGDDHHGTAVEGEERAKRQRAVLRRRGRGFCAILAGCGSVLG